MQTVGGKTMHTSYNGQRLRLKSIKHIIDVEIMSNYIVFACCLIMSGLISQKIFIVQTQMFVLISSSDYIWDALAE